LILIYQSYLLIAFNFALMFFYEQINDDDDDDEGERLTDPEVEQILKYTGTEEDLDGNIKYEGK